MKPFRGFTLIEVMIVVAIVAILSAIAYPSYLNYIRKARRADAIEALLRIEVAQERWRTNNPTYTTNLANLGVATPSGNYGLAIDNGATATAFTARATAQNDQVNDTACATMVLTGGTNPSRTPAACWAR